MLGASSWPFPRIPHVACLKDIACYEGAKLMRLLSSLSQAVSPGHLSRVSCTCVVSRASANTFLRACVGSAYTENLGLQDIGLSAFNRWSQVQAVRSQCHGYCSRLRHREGIHTIITAKETRIYHPLHSIVFVTHQLTIPTHFIPSFDPPSAQPRSRTQAKSPSAPSVSRLHCPCPKRRYRFLCASLRRSHCPV